LLIFAVGFSLPAVRLPGATPPFWHTKEGGRGWEGVREGVGKGLGRGSERGISWMPKKPEGLLFYKIVNKVVLNLKFLRLAK